MAEQLSLERAVVGAWRTNHQVTAYLIRAFPSTLWPASLPGIPRRTIRSVSAHLHNSRCMWIKWLGAERGIPPPAPVDHRTVTQRRLLAALKQSSGCMERLLSLGCKHGGRIPPTKAYGWRNLPLDVGHVLAYFLAHEAHHRGQLVMAARQLGQRLPPTVTSGLWQFHARAREADPVRPRRTGQ